MLRLTLILLLFITALQSAPVDCGAGSLADYLSLDAEGCRAGSLVVSGFSNPGVFPPGMEIDPAAIAVVPVAIPGQSGLQFIYDESVGSNEILQSVIEFVVSPFEGTPFTYSTLAISGTSVTGDGVAIGTDELCPGLLPCLSPAAVNTVFDAGFDASLLSRADFGPWTSIAVRHDIVIDGGLDGSAALYDATVRFGQVPEPATLLPVLAALAGVAAFRRRRARG